MKWCSIGNRGPELEPQKPAVMLLEKKGFEVNDLACIYIPASLGTEKKSMHEPNRNHPNSKIG
jgi:hypothetical protein